MVRSKVSLARVVIGGRGIVRRGVSGAKWWDAQAHPTRRDGSGLWRLQAERKAGAAGEVDGAGEDGAAVIGDAAHWDHGVEGWAFDPIAGS